MRQMLGTDVVEVSSAGREVGAPSHVLWAALSANGQSRGKHKLEVTSTYETMHLMEDSHHSALMRQRQVEAGGWNQGALVVDVHETLALCPKRRR